MCYGCLSGPPGHHTDDAHRERDEKLFKFIGFWSGVGGRTIGHDPQVIKAWKEDAQTKYRFSYRDFMEGTNTVS